MNKTILVTGATGFIGQPLVSYLVNLGYSVRAIVRRPRLLDGIKASLIQIDAMDEETNWREMLQGVDTIIHLAARVHIMRSAEKNPAAAYQRVNVDATRQLAQIAAQVGVRRFVFISSIKVNGESTEAIPFTEEFPVNPQDFYAVSKWNAERVLADISAKTGMELVILRLPLVYGPRVKANFLRLLTASYHGIPLPFASINNRRSLIYVGNLVSAIQACAEHPAAAGHTFLVSDGEDLSTPDLIRRIAFSLGHPSRLCRMPASLLKGIARLLHRTEEVERLLESLVIDSSKIRRLLDWHPPYSVDQGLVETAKWYLQQRQEKI
jgi:nucleoside-diphosphate-sugar epimerase